MEMLLQGKRGIRLHHNAFDLVARADVDSLVVAPRPVDSQMLIGLRSVLRLELFDHRLDLFGLIARSDQYGVRCGHHDNVVEADDGGDNIVFRARQTVAAVWKNTGPTLTLPSRSCGSTSQTGPAPTSDQPRSTGMTAARAVRSITA